MTPNKDTEDGITWDNENVVIFCEVCIEYITKHGRGQLMRWREIEELFTKKSGKKCNFKSLKNKYDSMKKDWRLWKIFKTGETGLGWNPTTGKLDCSDEWWEKKLKEKPEAKKYRHKGVWPLVEEKWDHLFGDSVATGVGCVAPSLHPQSVDKATNDVDEIQDVGGWSENAYHEYSQYSTRLDSLDNQEGVFWQNFTAEVSGIPNPTNSVVHNVVPKTNKGVKRRKKESGGSVLMREHIQQAQERHSEIVGMINQGRNNKKDEAGASIDQVVDIMTRMAEYKDVEIGGDIWLQAMLMFRNPVDRDLFYKMPSDDARLAWLKFAQTKNIS